MYEVMAISKKQVDFTEREVELIQRKGKNLNITIFQALPNKIATMDWFRN
jgi:hypothetical protein